MDQTTAFRLAFGGGSPDPARRAAALEWLRGRTDLHATWCKGLPYNPSAPVEVLCRVLTVPGDTFWLTREGVPAEVLTAAAGHPDAGVRSDAAGSFHFPACSLPALGRGTAAERSAVRLVLLLGHSPVPDETLTELIQSGDSQLRLFVAQARTVPPALRTSLLDDPDIEMRAAVLPYAWADLTPGQRAAWEADPHPSIVEAVAAGKRRAPVTTLDQFRAADMDRRGAAAQASTLDRAWAQALVADDSTWLRRAAAANPSLPLDLVHRLAIDADAGVRTAVAGRADLPADLVERLAHDPDDAVRLAVSVRPDLTEDQRQAIDYVVPPGRHPIYGWVADHHGDPAEMRRLTASAHPLIRRAVAAAEHLPPDVVAALENDDDFFVRLTLAFHCLDVTGDFMVRTYEEWDGKWSFQLLLRPTFPRAGLAHLADHVEQKMRDLAVRDPLLGPETVERLGRYGDPRVPVDHAIDHLDMVAAVHHPGLTPAAMHLMLDLAGAAARYIP